MCFSEKAEDGPLEPVGKRQAITEVKSANFGGEGMMDRSVDKGVDSDLTSSSDRLKSGATCEGTLLSEEFFLNCVRQGLQEYFKGELENFVG